MTPAKRASPAPNPWRFSPREVEVLNAYAEHGCAKSAAAAIGANSKTVDAHMERIMAKGEFRNRVQTVIAWDRWARAQK